MKISELSKELGATSKDIIALANDLGIECKAATKNLSDEEMQTVKNAFLKKSGAKEEKPAKAEKKESTKVKIVAQKAAFIGLHPIRITTMIIRIGRPISPRSFITCLTEGSSLLGRPTRCSLTEMLSTTRRAER